MNQNYNSPVFILDESLLGEDPATGVIAQFKQTYPTFKEAFNFTMCGGHIFAKVGDAYYTDVCRLLEVNQAGEIVLSYKDNTDTVHEALITYANSGGGGGGDWG